MPYYWGSLLFYSVLRLKFISICTYIYICTKTIYFICQNLSHFNLYQNYLLYLSESFTFTFVLKLFTYFSEFFTFTFVLFNYEQMSNCWKPFFKFNNFVWCSVLLNVASLRPPTHVNSLEPFVKLFLVFF